MEVKATDVQATRKKLDCGMGEALRIEQQKRALELLRQDNSLSLGTRRVLEWLVEMAGRV